MIRHYFHVIEWGLLLSFCFLSCSSNESFTEGNKRVICQLQENLVPIGQLESLCTRDSTFIVSTGDELIFYDNHGNQKTIVNKKGRSRYEYIDASIVRCHNENTYVWCPYLMKFIAYDSSGEGISECRYSSAVFDFLPYDGKIFIYTEGIRQNHIIDVLDFSTGAIVDSLVRTTKEHEVLLMQASTAPISLFEDGVFFSPRDRLEIYRYSITEGSCKSVAEIQSSSFISTPFTLGSIDGDVLKSVSYTFKNSYTVGLAVKDSQYLILATEGSANLENDFTLTNKSLYSSLYTIKRGNTSEQLVFKDLVNPRLVSSYNGSLFCIEHEIIDSNDVYYLARLSE